MHYAIVYWAMLTIDSLTTCVLMIFVVEDGGEAAIDIIRIAHEPPIVNATRRCL